MSFIVRSISAPYRWYYGEETDNPDPDNNNTNEENNNNTNEEDNNNTNEIKQEQPDTNPEIVPVLPLTTSHEGNVFLYYKINDRVLFHQLKKMDETDEDIDEISSVKTLFKWAFNKNSRTTHFITIAKNLTRTVNKIIYIEAIIENNPHIEYGPIDDIDTVNRRLIRRPFNVDPSRPLSIFSLPNYISMRIFYGLKWIFELDLVENWEKILSVNSDDPDLLEVTKKDEKIQLYVSYINRYRRLIEKGINFRKRYINNLETPNITNGFEKEFISELTSLFREVIDYVVIYNQFKNSLNWWEARRYDDYIKKIDKFPTLNINISWKYEALFSL